jgi:hypothetical protein
MAEIFVFGSNLAGRHGKGAALEAKMNGRGFGLQGASYAIPTNEERSSAKRPETLDKLI